jgi:hypothetical protein
MQGYWTKEQKKAFDERRDMEVLATVISEAHRNNKMAVAHTMSIEASERAIKAGIDGLMHIFVDRPHTREIIDAIVNSGAFVCPTIVAGASTIGDSDAAEFAKDERVRSKLSEEWFNALHKHIATYPQGKTAYLLKAVKALHDAGRLDADRSANRMLTNP